MYKTTAIVFKQIKVLQIFMYVSVVRYWKSIVLNNVEVKINLQIN